MSRDVSTTKKISRLPLVSVIVPVYNVENYIVRCLDTIIDQTYQNLEILLVDDGTPDNSGKICEEYALKDERITVFHKQNGGLSDARNYGINRAQGEYITFIDSDDYIDVDYIEYLYELISKYHCKMALCTHRIKYDSGRVRELGDGSDESLDAKACLVRMLYHDVIDTSAWAKLYHRSIFEEIRFPKGKIFEDIGTIYKTFLKCNFVACGYSAKYTYVIHENSIVNGQFTPQKFDMLDMTDKMAFDVMKRYPELIDAINRRRIYARFSTLNQMLNCNEFINERNEIIRFIKVHRKWIISNRKAPCRDKIAILLLLIDYNIYRMIWLKCKR